MLHLGVWMLSSLLCLVADFKLKLTPAAAVAVAPELELQQAKKKKTVANNNNNKQLVFVCALLLQFLRSVNFKLQLKCQFNELTAKPTARHRASGKSKCLDRRQALAIERATE